MEPEKKKNRNKWLELLSIPAQMGAVIFLFSWCGGWLDREHPHPTIDYRVVLTLIGVAVSMTSVILQVNRMNRK